MPPRLALRHAATGVGSDVAVSARLSQRPVSSSLTRVTLAGRHPRIPSPAAGAARFQPADGGLCNRQTPRRMAPAKSLDRSPEQRNTPPWPATYGRLEENGRRHLPSRSPVLLLNADPKSRQGRFGRGPADFAPAMDRGGMIVARSCEFWQNASPARRGSDRQESCPA